MLESGGLGGPSIVTRPGATLSMRIVNKLPANPKADAPRGSVEIPIVHNNMEAMDYQMSEVPFAPKVGTCEEWVISNDTDDANPFHLHTNSFQLVAINGIPNNPMEIWDTFMVPPKVNGKNGSITIRTRFVQWYGKDVFHCHILPHEDTGMMQNFLMA